MVSSLHTVAHSSDWGLRAGLVELTGTCGDVGLLFISDTGGPGSGFDFEETPCHGRKAAGVRDFIRVLIEIASQRYQAVVLKQY